MDQLVERRDRRLMAQTIAIVGANLAGGHAAHQLRRSGFDSRIVLIGGESHLPYERPPLSKEVLLGTAEPQTATIWPESDYLAAEIEVVLGTRVTALDPGERRLQLDDGRSLVADQVLLCTGASPRRLPLPGAALAGVRELRTVDDAVELRNAFEPGTRVVVIGAGFIGAEVAAAAIGRGCEVAMVEVASLPLQRVLGNDVGTMYAALHRSRGVDVRLGVVVEAIEGRDHCRSVRLADGAVLPADVVVCGVGVAPRTELADGAGLTVANGIVVDGQCRTSIGNVFAAGDVATRPSSYAAGHIRLESFQNAQNQGVAAAKAMIGGDETFDDVPWFWSDQFEINLQVAGFPTATDAVVWRGDRDALDCVAFYLRDGLVEGAVGMNRPREVRAAMDLIRNRVRVAAGVLSDESVDLRRLRSPASVQ